MYVVEISQKRLLLIAGGIQSAKYGIHVTKVGEKNIYTTNPLLLQMTKEDISRIAIAVRIFTERGLLWTWIILE